MIDKTLSQAQITATATPPRAHVLHMVQGDRTAGSMPVWGAQSATQDGVEAGLSKALKGEKGADARSFDDVLNSYAPSSGAPVNAQTQEFSFGDLVDMINPLQHIPIVGHIYRELTGDTIRSIGGIVGGALFGGPLGMAGGLVNAVIEEETGKDAAGNALAMMSPAQKPHYNGDNLGNLLALADLKAPNLKAQQNPVSGAATRAENPAPDADKMRPHGNGLFKIPAHPHT